MLLFLTIPVDVVLDGEAMITQKCSSGYADFVSTSFWVEVGTRLCRLKNETGNTNSTSEAMCQSARLFPVYVFNVHYRAPRGTSRSDVPASTTFPVGMENPDYDIIELLYSLSQEAEKPV